MATVSEAPPVIMYRHGLSASSKRLEIVMLLKKIPHYRVNVCHIAQVCPATIAPMIPRPEISELLGITYRRTPLLAIGNDVYCDTSLIIPVLERRFPAGKGYGTVYPGAKVTGADNSALMNIFSRYYTEAALIPLSAGLQSWDSLPEEYVKDKALLLGRPFDPQVYADNRGEYQSTIASHLHLIEFQLQDGKEWVFDTDLPSLADVSIYLILNWIHEYPASQGLIDLSQYPNTTKWLDRLSQHIGAKKRDQRKAEILTGEQAADKIVSASYEPLEVVGFDRTQASLLGLKPNDLVSIAPEDNGTNYPTIGSLVAFTKAEMVVRVAGSKGVLHCHFPRLGYSIRSTSQKSKL